jgi:hypothetical protein
LKPVISATFAVATFLDLASARRKVIAPSYSFS